MSYDSSIQKYINDFNKNVVRFRLPWVQYEITWRLEEMCWYITRRDDEGAVTIRYSHKRAAANRFEEVLDIFEHIGSHQDMIVEDDSRKLSPSELFEKRDRKKPVPVKPEERPRRVIG